MARGGLDLPDGAWSRRQLLAAVAASAALAGLLMAGAIWWLLGAGLGRTQSRSVGDGHPRGTAADRVPSGATSNPRGAADALAARPMPVVPAAAAHPGPVSLTDPGNHLPLPLPLPPATETGPAGVPAGFPHTPAGALAQLAAIDSAALQPADLDAARRVIGGWALPGGPTSTTWSGVRALAQLLDASGSAGAGNRPTVVITPLMGLIKGTVGADFVLPCVDFEIDVTVTQTARGAVADCQRMAWTGTRWMVGPGPEPVPPPSVWPDTATALAVGYRDLRRG